MILLIAFSVLGIIVGISEKEPEEDSETKFTKGQNEISKKKDYVLQMEMVIYKTTDETEEIDNEAMRQGREFEDYVARRFTEATGKKVRRANENVLR